MMSANRALTLVLFFASLWNVIGADPSLLWGNDNYSSSSSEIEIDTLGDVDRDVEVPLHQHPLLLIEREKKTSLAMPVLKDGRVKIGYLHYDDLVLACPVQKGRKSRTQQEKWLAQKKVLKRRIDIDGTIQSIPNLWRSKCRDEFTPVWKKTEEKCHGDGLIYEIGFEVLEGLGSRDQFLKKIMPGKKLKQKIEKKAFDWYPLYTVCYNLDMWNTYYIKYVIHGASVGARNELQKTLITYKRFSEESPTNPVVGASYTNPMTEEHPDTIVEEGPRNPTTTVEGSRANPTAEESPDAIVEEEPRNPTTTVEGSHANPLAEGNIGTIGLENPAVQEITSVVESKTSPGSSKNVSEFTEFTKINLDLLYKVNSSKILFCNNAHAPQIDLVMPEKENQKNVIEGIVGNNALTKYWDGQAKMLVKGFLMSEDDLPYPEWDDAIQLPLNIVPVWKEVYYRNWRKLKEYAREFASRMNGNLVVYAGTYDSLSLDTPHGTHGSVKLLTREEGTGKRRRIIRGHRVPKHLWMILFRTETQEGIAFLMLNNPNEKNCDDVKICGAKNVDVCAQHGWGKIKSDEPYKGCTYCCEVNALQKLSKIAFPHIKVKNTLTGVAPLVANGD